MRILIADDDDVARLALEAMLTRRGHDVVATADGTEAWQELQQPDPPRLAILDWLMPDLDGVEVCRRIRHDPRLKAMYLLLLTARGSKQHVLEGLRGGANDFIVKPFDHDELEARINVGVQVLRLQAELADHVRELELALAQVKQLEGLIPICSYCKKVRDDRNYWQQVETYIGDHSGVRFSHGICPGCFEREMKQLEPACGHSA
jgi:DNA-binding response OmpR family regulator